MLHLNPVDILISVLVIVPSLMVHEIAHAAAALAMGDTSQRERGRLTLNPLAHLDPVGFVMLVVLRFGWAKPVVFERQRFRYPSFGVVATALAGPFSNLLLAILGFAGLRLFIDPILANPLLQNFVLAFIITNLGLFCFNLLPIPPLDGSHLLNETLLRRRPDLILRFNQFGGIILLAIFLLQSLLDREIIPLSSGIQYLFTTGLALAGLA